LSTAADHRPTNEQSLRPRDKWLALVLRILGVTALPAIVAVFMPLSWTAAAHRWLGMGALPEAPILDYLARSLSAFYVIFGAMALMLAANVERYRPLAALLGVSLAIYGLIFVGIDLWVGLPWWWIAAEGPPCLLVGGWIAILARE